LSESDPAVLGNDRGERHEPGDRLGPAGRAAGDEDDRDARLTQLLERDVGRSFDAPLGRQRPVEITEESADWAG
jgi:hypothetical protein